MTSGVERRPVLRGDVEEPERRAPVGPARRDAGLEDALASLKTWSQCVLRLTTIVFSVGLTRAAEAGIQPLRFSGRAGMTTLEPDPPGLPAVPAGEMRRDAWA